MKTNNVTPSNADGDIGTHLEGGSSQDLASRVESMVKNFKPEGEESEFDTTEKMSWWAMVKRNMDGGDAVRFAIGSFCAVAMGAGLPGFTLFFGEMIDGIGETGASDGAQFNSLQKSSFIMMYIGVGFFFIAGAQVSAFSTFGEIVTYKTQVNYFRAALEQDAYFYENQSVTEMASKITKEMAAIRRGSGAKFGQILFALSSFVMGIAFSFYWGWLMNLILLAFVPLIVFTGVLMSYALQSGLTESLKAYSQSAGYAEQALQAIKIVHTYGQEKLEDTNFKKYLYRCDELANKTNISGAFGIAGIMVSFIGFYAYSFYFGGWLRWNEIKNWNG
jgi:ABC-type multidrug transport system fused ATPase/permease subunit